MFSRLRKALAAAGIAAAVAAPMSASAAAIELSLVLDASGSINSTEWNLQRNAYANALAAVIPTDGSIAISVVRFATTASVVYNMTTISSAADLTNLTTFFGTLSQSGNGSSTCISCGIIAGEGTFTGTATRSVIDVSTDGSWNVGVNPAGLASTVGTAAWAVSEDADVVNALGIGVMPNFASGPDSFNMMAADFAAFESALITKLRRETGQVPLPGALALIGIGLLGLGMARRRMA